MSDYDENRAQTRKEYDEAVAFCVWLRARAAEAHARGQANRCTRLAVAANVVADSFLPPPPVCGGALAYECLAGMRVFRTVRRKRVYSARCSVCRMTADTDGTPTTCTLRREVKPDTRTTQRTKAKTGSERPCRRNP